MKNHFTLICLLLGYAFAAHSLPSKSSSFATSGMVTSSKKLTVLTANENISVNLYALNIDGSTSLQDGALTLYDPLFNNAVDLNDFRKLNNFAENFAIQKPAATLAIEKRQPVNLSDTIFFKMWQMRQKSYQLEVVANNMNHPGLVAYLEDSYMNTATSLSLTGTTLVNFSINALPASADINRFRIVFRTPGAMPLAVDINSFKAARQNNQINIEWRSTGAAGASQYLLEKSVDGQQFSSLNNFAAVDNEATYRWTDMNPAAGLNYYRIKTVQNNGEFTLSPFQKVNYLKNNIAVSLLTNPVTNNIGLQLSGLPRGSYSALLVNNYGQVVLNELLRHEGGTAVKNLAYAGTLPGGIYQLQFSGQGMQPQTINVFVQSK